VTIEAGHGTAAAAETELQPLLTLPAAATTHSTSTARAAAAMRERPLRNATPGLLAAFFIAGVLSVRYLPATFVPRWEEEWPRLSCRAKAEQQQPPQPEPLLGWCGPGLFDLTFSPALALAPVSRGSVAPRFGCGRYS
jgi:hypothetical protein